MVVNGHMHIYTVEMGSNSMCVCVCVQSDGPALQCFDSLSWNEGVMSLFLWGFRVTGMRLRGVKTTLDSLLFPASPPPLPPSLKYYLSSPYVSNTEVSPHPSPCHLDWIQNVYCLNQDFNLIPPHCLVGKGKRSAA